MSNADESAVSPERQVFAQQFVQALMERYASYHHHKETMAYGGLTIFAATVGTGLVSSD
jgi:hypothetical protein